MKKLKVITISSLMLIGGLAFVPNSSSAMACLRCGDGDDGSCRGNSTVACVDDTRWYESYDCSIGASTMECD